MKILNFVDGAEWQSSLGNKTINKCRDFYWNPFLITKKTKNFDLWPRELLQNTVLPCLVRRRTIKLMSFLIKKDHSFWAISWDFWHFLAEKPWFEIAMTLINFVYLPKSIQKVNRGIFFLYKGVVLNGESH